MSKFKVVYKGYEMSQVDKYVKETEEKILELTRIADGKSPVTEDELKKREEDIARKAAVLDSTFTVFMKLVKSKLSDKSLEEFILVADSIERMSHSASSELKKVKNANAFVREQPVVKSQENTKIMPEILPEEISVSQSTICGQAEDEKNIEAPTPQSIEKDFTTIAKKEEPSTTLQGKTQPLQEKVEVSQQEAEEQPATEIQQNLEEEVDGEPLIDLNEVYHPNQSLKEMCLDLGIIDDKQDK